MQPVGGDADLGAHAVHRAVGEAGGRVHVDGGRVDLAREALGGGRVLGHDCLGVPGAVAVDVLKRLIEVVDHPQGDLHVEELGRPGRLAVQHLHALRRERLGQRADQLLLVAVH